MIAHLHDRILAQTGGETGILSLDTVATAIDRAQHGPFPAPPDLALRAAFLVRGICQEHPFVDGNKRTGFASADLLYRRNGYRIAADRDQIIAFVLDVAQGRLDIEAIAAWLDQHGQRLKGGEAKQ